MSNVAFLGTGFLGSGMVERMLKHGHHVTVWNRTQEKARALGAKVSSTPEEAAASAERVHFALPDDPVVERMLERIAPHLATGAVVIDHSTTLPAATKARLPRCAWNARTSRVFSTVWATVTWLGEELKCQAR